LAQVVDAGDGLLPAVAALRQVHGGPQQIQLAHERPMVDVLRVRSPRLDTQGVPRIAASDLEPLVAPLTQHGPLDDRDAEVDGGTRVAGGSGRGTLVDDRVR